MAYKTTSLGQAVLRASAYDNSYLLPAMQRPYVWEKSDAIKLFNSIYKGFPIGTSLLWETKSSGDRKLGANRVYKIPFAKTESNHLYEMPVQEGQDITLVLDGQQRLTTMNIALNGYWESKKEEREKMFFNMDVEPSNKSKLPFVIADSVDGDNYIPCHDIMKWKTRDLFEEYVSINNISLTLNWHKNINNLYSRIWVDEAFCYGECKAETMGDAVDIFVVSNSSGKSLDMTDLIMAYLSTSWDTIDAKNEVKTLVSELNKKFNKSKPFSTKSILKIFLCVSKDEKGNLLPSSTSNILKSLDADLIKRLENQWIHYRKSIFDVCTLIERWGLAKAGLLKSTNAVIPVLLWLMKNNVDITSETKDVAQNLELARRWLLMSLINGVFGGQSDSAIADTRKTILESNADSLAFPLAGLLKDGVKHGKYAFYNESDIMSFLSNLEYSKDNSTISLLLYLVRGSYFKGIDRDTAYHLDHIFSKSDNPLVFINNIGNIQLLPSKDNQKKSNRHPKMLWNSDNYGDEFLEMNILPVNPLYTDDGNYLIYDYPEKLIPNREVHLSKKIASLLELQ
ncbi:DUF262 domain-containing protein [Vibrio renipiscarius]|uniref:GmrSD restriction endonucleases N-terminal domain-containing protein n=1 Tax=Vibrio renipiscarius TaxID=1461322 RepID=A0A0C2N925_9VIBR|nr:DUF262 domain-containing protein [Vibrio renipiscarius]KII76126.1 hypothetical protein OJ16_15015 [Vibrio renipiscarius]KII78536.1 hypothetical protein PL18_12185 [Vibrio renipiscarius]